MPFSARKIDRSFAASRNADRTNAGRCQTIIELAHPIDQFDQDTRGWRKRDLSVMAIRRTSMARVIEGYALMQIVHRRGWEIPEHQATPEGVVMNRRGFLNVAAG